jgi:hypothetical protein
MDATHDRYSGAPFHPFTPAPPPVEEPATARRIEHVVGRDGNCSCCAPVRSAVEDGGGQRWTLCKTCGFVGSKEQDHWKAWDEGSDCLEQNWAVVVPASALAACEEKLRVSESLNQSQRKLIEAFQGAIELANGRGDHWAALALSAANKGEELEEKLRKAEEERKETGRRLYVALEDIGRLCTEKNDAEARLAEYRKASRNVVRLFDALMKVRDFPSAKDFIIKMDRYVKALSRLLSSSPATTGKGKA